MGSDNGFEETLVRELLDDHDNENPLNDPCTIVVDSWVTGKVIK